MFLVHLCLSSLKLIHSMITLLFTLYDSLFGRLFLIGLDRYGKGDWRSISRNVVVTRTPTQVASHAQKYFLRHTSGKKERKRSSIHDITTAMDSLPMPAPTNLPGHDGRGGFEGCDFPMPR